MSVGGIFSGVAGAVFQTSPIILTNGIATSLWSGINGVTGNSLPSFVQGGIPLSLFTEALNTVVGGIQQLSGTGVLSQSFANYKPLPGSTLAKYQVGQYPFYNQQIAANASIQEPLTVSMLMYCPATSATSLSGIKLGIMSLVQSTLQNHIQAGGTFTVITPAYVYTDCLLTGMTDVSTEETLQTQWAYQLDFIQPLLDSPTPSALSPIFGLLSSGGTAPNEVVIG